MERHARAFFDRHRVECPLERVHGLLGLSRSVIDETLESIAPPPLRNLAVGHPLHGRVERSLLRQVEDELPQDPPVVGGVAMRGRQAS